VNQIKHLAPIGILVFILIIGISSIVYAAPSLKWSTDSVYYNSQGNLVVEGYFYNDGTRIVNWVNNLNLQVYFRNINTDWWLKANTSFKNLNVFIRPGEISRWTLRISDVDYSYFDYWYVGGRIDYTYL
jgi:hypothetical protein